MAERFQQSEGPYQTERTNLGCKSRGGADFTSGCSEVDDLYFIGVLQEQR